MSKPKRGLGCVVGLGLLVVSCGGFCGIGLLLPTQTPTAKSNSQTPESTEPINDAPPSKRTKKVTNVDDSPKPSGGSPTKNSDTSNEEIKPVKKRLINYEIIKRDKVPKFKESFDIRVGLVDGRLPNKEELAAISAKLRNKSFDKTFVCFYLPGMVVDAGAFAIAHHDPDTRPVQIITARLSDKYKNLLRAADAELVEKDKGFPGKLLGHWITTDGRRMVIRENELTHILPKSTFTSRVARIEPIDGGYRVVTVEYGKEYPQKWKITGDEFSITDPGGLRALLGSPYRKALNPSRIWKDNTGKFSIKGEFTAYRNGKVLIRKEDGEEIEVPVGRLSDTDKDLLKKLLRERGTKADF